MSSEIIKRSRIAKHVLHSTLSIAIAKFFFLISGFFLTPFILHHIGATQYGLWALVGSVVAYGSLLDFGIGTILIRYIAELYALRQQEDAGKLIVTALYLYSCIAVIVFLLGVAIAPGFPRLFNVPADQVSTATSLVLLMGSGVGISILCTLTTAILRGLQRYDINSLLNTIAVGLYVVGAVVVLLMGGDVLQLVVVSIAVKVFMQIPAIWFIRRLAPELHLVWQGPSKRWMQKILSFGSWLFVLEVSGRVQTKTDELVIGAFLPVSSITPFAIARRLGEVGQIISDQFIKVLLPLASQLTAENDLAALRSVYITSTRVTLAILAPIFCILVLLGKWVLTAWVGTAYAGYAHLVSILALAILIDTSAWPAGSILQGLAKPRPLALMSACGAIANLALSILLVRRLGLTGVALGTLIPNVMVVFGLVLPYAMRLMSINLTDACTQIALPAILPALPMVLVIYCAKQVIGINSLISLVLVTVIATFVYGLGYFTFGASHLERQTYRNYVLSATHFAEAWFKR